MKFDRKSSKQPMSRFDSACKRIWECLSTDVMGNSQPTDGVFSGDNFARGDMRIPMPLGWGTVPKRKKRRNRRWRG